MPDISYAQVDFSAGEWSPAFRGRINDKEYTSALTQCLNYIPNQEGSLSPRSGFKRIGLTQHGAPAKLLPFRFSYYQPYVAEFTSYFLRFWANGFPVWDDRVGTIASTAGDPPTFTLANPGYPDTTDFIPPSWNDGDPVSLFINSAASLVTDGRLANREFILNIVSRAAGTFTLSDAVSGSPLTGAITSIVGAKVYRMIVHETLYEGIDILRQVAFTSGGYQQDFDASGHTRDGPVHKVSYLHPYVSPRSIQSNRLSQGLLLEFFIDGPYLDSAGDIPITVSGTSGLITIRLHGYSTLIIYSVGDITYDGANFFVSLVDSNINNALPTPPAATPFWASLPQAWSGATTYDEGHAATYLPLDANDVPTTYYSIQAANLNKNPRTQPLWWATTPLTYAGGTTYADGAIASDGLSPATYYVSLSAGNIGNALANTTFWLPYDVEAAVDERYNSLTGWPSQGVILPGDGLDYPIGNGDNIPRLIRLKATPQPWLATRSYTAGDYVNYKDNIYIAITSANLNNIPDQSASNWEIQSKTILWTWGWIATSSNDDFTATVLIKGDALPNTNPCWGFRLGLYGHTTGWPTCGVYHEGRLWLGSPAQNRFDAGRTNLGYDFSPTAPDGTVADNNAISYTLNAASDEVIHAFASIAEGVLICTSEREWLISASNLNDPLTPTSIQVHPVTSYGTTNRETALLPNGVAFIQTGRRRLMEFRAFVDIASYQSRLNSVDITRKCQHLTVDGIIEAAYQRVPQPVIWCLPGGLVDSTSTTIDCPPAGVVVTQTNIPARTRLFGVGWSRTPDVSYVAPFSTEHGRELQTDDAMLVTSICVQRGQIDTAEYLYQAVTQMDGDNLTYMEVLQPVFESSPLEDVLFTSGSDTGEVSQFGTLSQSYMLDSAMTPAGCQIAVNGLSATFYGLYRLASSEVSFTIRGKYVGDFTIAADGSINVPFVTGTFEKTDIGRAMDLSAPNATLLTAEFQRFYLDKNGNTGVMEPSTTSDLFYGQFGFAYRRRGQVLRPSAPGANGPQFAKIRRNERFGVYVEAAQEISAGDTFNTLNSMELTVPRTDGKVSAEPVGPANFVTGIFRAEINDDNTFDGNLCWEQTRPVVGAILAVGGFELLTDT